MILVRLVQLSKAPYPMVVTGFPSMFVGMISAPNASLSQPVIVTALRGEYELFLGLLKASPLISYFKLGLRDTASAGSVSLLFSPSHPMRKLKAKSEIKCFMLITNY